MFKPIDWDTCYLCQGQSTDVLVAPLKKLGYVPERNLYITTANLLMEWEVIERIDRSLQRRLSAYTMPDGLSDDFIKNNACFQKKCLSKYDIEEKTS